MSIEDMINVLQGAKNGKQIQGSDKGESNWVTLTGEVWWNFRSFDYRIKPRRVKPRQEWLVRKINLRSVETFSIIPSGYIKVREVLE